MTGDSISRYRARPVHVAGISGAEGYAVAMYLLSRGFTDLTAHDIHRGESLFRSFSNAHIALPRPERDSAFRRLLDLRIRFRLGEEYLSGIDAAELIFAGQNWFSHPENAPIATARERGVPVRFLIQLYFELSPAPIAAVTGTNGKTTVANALYHILQCAGKPVLMSGNDRYHVQVLDRLDTLDPAGTLVLEVSNRQLLELHMGPHVAVITNIGGDHIAEHGSFDAYAAVKKRLFDLQHPGGWAVINADDSTAARILNDCPSRPVPYSLAGLPGTGSGPAGTGFCLRLDGKIHFLFDREDLRLPGSHNLSNLLAAATGASLLGVSPEDIRSALKTFPGVRNRLQCIGTVDGVDYVDDQASTNPAATLAALDAQAGPVILIAGGDLKGNENDYLPLADRMAGSVRRLFLLDGTAADILLTALNGRIPAERVKTLSDAVRKAHAAAREGDTVLLSPSGAAFYSRFASAGTGFRRLVRDLSRGARRHHRDRE